MKIDSRTAGEFKKPIHSDTQTRASTYTYKHNHTLTEKYRGLIILNFEFFHCYKQKIKN